MPVEHAAAACLRGIGCQCIEQLALCEWHKRRTEMAEVEALPTMCLGHGMCVKIAPEVFRLDRWGCVEVIQKTVPDELVPRARIAVYRCPAKALLINEG